MAQIIIATHGGLSKGMLDSLHMVAGGAADGIETYSLEFGQNPNDYYEELRERIAATEEQFIIMCDIKGGSVHNALFRLTELPNEFGQNPNDYYEELRERIAATEEQFIIMCDIKGGSVHNALFRLTELPNVVIFSGLTMGMALEIALTAREGLDADAAHRVLDAAREGVTVAFGGAPVEEEEDEDF